MEQVEYYKKEFKINIGLKGFLNYSFDDLIDYVDCNIKGYSRKKLSQDELDEIKKFYVSECERIGRPIL